MATGMPPTNGVLTSYCTHDHIQSQDCRGCSTVHKSSSNNIESGKIGCMVHSEPTRSHNVSLCLWFVAFTIGLTRGNGFGRQGSVSCKQNGNLAKPVFLAHRLTYKQTRFYINPHERAIIGVVRLQVCNHGTKVLRCVANPSSLLRIIGKNTM
jgi:hypothetical protein